jgi:hypothetical protein
MELQELKVKEKKVPVRYLQGRIGVRYWEDIELNEVDASEDGDDVPCKDGDNWCPLIDLSNGKIMNWGKGIKAKIHIKSVDDNDFYILDENKEIIFELKDVYVPKIMCPKENGYGDYVIMDIDENGFIENFDNDISGIEELD